MYAYQNEVRNWRSETARYAASHQREYDGLANKSSQYARECKALADVHRAIHKIWLGMPDDLEPAAAHKSIAVVRGVTPLFDQVDA